MKHRLTIYLLTLLLLFGLGSGCKEFLNVQSEDQLSRADLFNTVRGANAAVIGLYESLDRYYQFRFPVYADLQGNMQPPPTGSGSQGQFLGLQRGFVRMHGQDVDPTLESTGIPGIYQQAYSILFQANDIIAALPLVQDASPERLASLGAEAKAFRALVHFDLVRMFGQAPGFSPDGDHPGIALIDGVPGIFDQPSRATVAEVYALVRSDLETAAMEIDPAFSQRSGEIIWLTPSLIQGLIARVAAYQQDWEACQIWADRCIANSDRQLTPASSYLTAWQSGRLPEVLWELDLQRVVEGSGGTALPQTPAQIVGVRNAEPFMEANADLVDLYQPQDLRRSLLNRNEEGVYLSEKWPLDTGEIRNPPLFRLSEAYLLRAEANVELNNLAAATGDYLAIHSRALPDDPAPPTDQEGLRQAIRLERRLELAFENHHFFDLGRWGVPLERTRCREGVVERCILPYPDDKFVLPIPFEAILLNPNLEQNPGY